MRIGKCKLCLGDSLDLQDSHFLPKGVYRILRDGGAPNPNPWLISEGQTVQASHQLTAPLFCRDCEQRLSRNGERWVLTNCLKKDGSFPLAAILASRTPDVSSATDPTRVYWAANVPEVNSQALAYFGASMFWRGSIHPWSQGTVPVELGPFRESFREYLMGLSDFPNHCALLVAVREGKAIDRLTHIPVGERMGLCHIYKFPMPGLAFSLAVGKNIPAHFRGACFVHMPGNPIIVSPIIEELLRQDASQVLQKNYNRRFQAEPHGKRKR
jgi:hypothetical protein